MTAKCAAAHKLPVREPVTSPSAVAGEDGRRVAPPTASEQVLGGEGGGGAADVRGVDRPGRAVERVGYAATSRLARGEQPAIGRVCSGPRLGQPGDGRASDLEIRL